MSSNMVSALNTRLRLSGMSSGLDTDSIIKQLMKVEAMKVDKVKQQKQLLEWKRDDYRSITNLLRGFKDEYFDVLKPATNLRSSDSLSAYKITYNGADTYSAFTATPEGGAIPGTYTISNVKVAETAKVSSYTSITGDITGSSISPTINDISAANNNNKLVINFNGTSKEITIDDGLNGIDDVINNLDSKLTALFGAGKITVGKDVDGDQLTFATSSTNTLSFSAAYASSIENGGLEALGLKNINASNKLNMNLKLTDLASSFNRAIAPNVDTDGDGYDIEFTINNKLFQFKSTQTLSEIVSTVNADPDAKVKMVYDQLNDKFTVTSNETGAMAKVSINDAANEGNLMFVLGLTGPLGAGTSDTGVDASIDYFDGTSTQTITRATNDFTMNGISFSLKANSAVSVEMKVAGDTTKSFELIKNFVNKYNEIVDKLNSEVSEKRYKDYVPLTDEQRETMSEKQIEQWEEKAKSGMLENDSLLSGLLSQMRSAFYQEIKGVGGTPYSIGITTGTWEQRGKLVINETKLKDAIANNPELVTDIFSKESDTAYSPNMDSASRTKRNEENGIANRFNDIIQDYIRTNRDTSNRKGLLLERAGITGDASNYENALARDIKDKDAKIETLLDRLLSKEDYYYKKFAALEKALNQMNSQSAWLTQQFGGGQ
jgi:flagellar hook-associated protein 2